MWSTQAAVTLDPRATDLNGVQKDSRLDLTAQSFTLLLSTAQSTSETSFSFCTTH